MYMSKDGNGTVVVNEDVLDSVSREHETNSVELGMEIVLVLARMELISFIAACMVLCVVFVTETVLITYQCFSNC